MLDSWTQERVERLTKLWAAGLSCSQIAGDLRGVTRNAVIGKIHRMGLSGRVREPKAGNPQRRITRPRIPRAKKAPRDDNHRTVFKIVANGNGYRNFESSEAVSVAKLRCVEVNPRHLTFAQIEENDCRYPYGGEQEGETITFCGHPRFVYERAGLKVTSSYCGPHYSLTIGRGTTSERIATHGVAA